MKPVIIIGYSGHAYVVLDIFENIGLEILGYMDHEKKDSNPYGLSFLGREDDPDAMRFFSNSHFFVSIGSNTLRASVFLKLSMRGFEGVNALHPSAIIGRHVSMGIGNMLAANVTVNSMSVIGSGVIINSGAVVDHECHLADYVHVAPGAVLAGNVSVGESSFIGAQAVIKEGVSIGKNAIVGAGAVVIRDIPDGSKIAGNPARIIS
jgi:sugar O-acyltransferase (sialic acid O-acetyltransferase NeuD family)